jgi:hypothetical protein
MPGVRKVVYVDTNVVLEAHRTGCWADLVERFDVRTVELIQIEAQSGDRRQRGYVTVNMREFCAKVTVSKVTDVHRLRASARAPALTALDAGELDLLAFVASEDPGSLLLTTADKAAIKTACQLGLEAQLVSLEEMAKQCGKNPPLKRQYTKSWLGQVRTEFLFETDTL